MDGYHVIILLIEKVRKSRECSGEPFKISFWHHQELWQKYYNPTLTHHDVASRLVIGVRQTVLNAF